MENESFNPGLPEEEIVTPQLEIEEGDALFSSDENKEISALWTKPPFEEPSVVVRDVALAANHINQFEGAVHSNAGEFGIGYDISFTIARQPASTQLPNRHLSQIRQKDQIHFAIWCSLAAKKWYSHPYRRAYNGGNQTPWIPLDSNGIANSGSVTWIPPQNFNPDAGPIVHSLMLRRVSPGLVEYFVWQTGPGAPFPYTNNQALQPATPAQDQLAKGLRRVFKISPNNPKGLELWARPKYRQPIKN